EGLVEARTRQPVPAAAEHEASGPQGSPGRLVVAEGHHRGGQAQSRSQPAHELEARQHLGPCEVHDADQVPELFEGTGQARRYSGVQTTSTWAGVSGRANRAKKRSAQGLRPYTIGMRTARWRPPAMMR